MPDGPREKFEPKVVTHQHPEPEAGFTPRNTSGLGPRELAALNRALDKLMSRGLSKYEAKQALHFAVAEWLNPTEAAEADLDRLLAWR